MDVGVLMGNIEDVADMSQRLLTALEGAVQGKGFEEQVIGMYRNRWSFKLSQFQNIYNAYCYVE